MKHLALILFSVSCLLFSARGGDWTVGTLDVRTPMDHGWTVLSNAVSGLSYTNDIATTTNVDVDPEDAAYLTTTVFNTNNPFVPLKGWTTMSFSTGGTSPNYTYNGGLITRRVLAGASHAFEPYTNKMDSNDRYKFFGHTIGQCWEVRALGSIETDDTFNLEFADTGLDFTLVLLAEPAPSWVETPYIYDHWLTNYSSPSNPLPAIFKTAPSRTATTMPELPAQYSSCLVFIGAWNWKNTYWDGTASFYTTNQYAGLYDWRYRGLQSGDSGCPSYILLGNQMVYAGGLMANTLSYDVLCQWLGHLYTNNGLVFNEWDKPQRIAETDFRAP